jgi:hypothetical protein
METLTLLDGHGWLVGDWSLAVIAFTAALTTMMTMTGVPKGLKVLGIWTVAIGWAIVSGRLFFVLLNGGDPIIPPITLMALSLIGAGTVFYVLGSWVKK